MFIFNLCSFSFRYIFPVKSTMWTTLCILFTFAFPIGTQKPNSVLSLIELFNENTKLYDEIDHIDLLTEYDFIIVGAGTAGCVLANRLSEISDWKILLLEAGGSENIIMDIPITAGSLQFTSANWKYKTEPSEKYCHGFKNKQCLWPRGKVLGGSSVLNFMIYTRGSREDYDNWESMGNDGWGWHDVLPYFKKIENFNIPTRFDSKYHSKSGHVNIEYAPFRTETGKQWIKAAQELGFKYNDYNGPEPSGVSYMQLSQKNSTRHSSNRAYLNPVKHRHNLHISKNTLVTKLLLEDSNASVLGVEIERNNKRQKIFARKEVIVSAGAINSPHLLMLSGIGPKEHLDSVNIKVVKDLPVGSNLMDHIAMGAMYFSVDSPIFPSNNSSNYLETVMDWFKNRESPLSLPGGTEALVFMNHKDKFNTTLQPDVELIFAPGGPFSDFNEVFGIDEGTHELDTKSFLILPMLMRPKSRGKILLRNQDPKTHPIIIPNYLEHEEDMPKIIQGVKTAIDIAKQPALAKLGARIYNNPIKECLSEGDFGTDAYFACQTRKFTISIYHQSGTCKMGAQNDQTAVVDPRLRVHGITNLRVIDASIMPEIVSVHTNAPTYMIAEKGADMTKQDWGIFVDSH